LQCSCEFYDEILTYVGNRRAIAARFHSVPDLFPQQEAFDTGPNVTATSF
jgi:hypothetical protein